MTTARVLAVAAAVCLLPLRADADASKAWAAAKANLPADTHVLLGMDVAAVTSSSVFRTVFPLLLSQQSEMKDTFSLLETTCKIDPMKAIDGFVVGTAKDSDHGAVFVALKGVTEAKVVACLEAIARGKDIPDAKVKVTRDKGITQLAFGDGDKVYLKWFGKDVLAIPLDIDNKAQLQKWAGSRKGLAKALVGKTAAKVNTRAAAWMVAGIDEDIDGVKTSLGYGSFDVRKGALAADLRIVTASAEDARSVADKAQQQLAMVANLGGDPAISSMVRALTVRADGPELVIKASLPEADLLPVLRTLMK